MNRGNFVVDVSDGNPTSGLTGWVVETRGRFSFVKFPKIQTPVFMSNEFLRGPNGGKPAI